MRMSEFWQNHAWMAVFCLLLSACGTGTTEQKKAPPAQALSAVASPPPAVITQQFSTFLKEFPTESGAKVYDADWLKNFMGSAAVKEISPKDCERYIYNKPIILESHEKRQLPPSHSYYYVGRLPDNGQYIALVFTDLSDGDISTYLCTYQRDGKFISGIVLQRLHEHLPEKHNVQHSVEVKKTPEKHIEIINEYSAGYQIDSTGKIQPLNAQAST